AKQAQAAQTGGLTQQQNDSIARMLELFGNVKDTAKRAFAGQDVKLRQEFQIGVNDPNDLGSILGRAKIVLASAKTAANASALKDKGWIADDTTEFEAVIKQVGDIDKSQQDSQSVAITGTDDRNTAANSLYDDLLTIQNAANIEFSSKDSGKTQRQTARMSSAGLDRIERDLKHRVGFHLAITATILDRLLFEMLGQLGNLDIGQTAVGFSNRGEFAGFFIAHGERVITQNMIALAVPQLGCDHDDIER